jgi:ribosomal protein S27AE
LVMAENRLTETFRRCPKCGADHFTQLASRGKVS